MSSLEFQGIRTNPWERTELNVVVTKLLVIFAVIIIIIIVIIIQFSINIIKCLFLTIHIRFN